MDILLNPATYEQDPENAWKRLKFQDRRPHVMGIFIEVAKWRDATAQTRNVPRNRVLKDDALRELAVQAPRHKTRWPNCAPCPKGLKTPNMPTSFSKRCRAAQPRKETLPELTPPVVNKPELGHWLTF